MISAQKVWRLGEGEPSARKLLAQEVGISPIVAQVLLNRGITTPQEARDFLSAPLTSIHDPFLMKDMDKAVARLKHAILAQEPILIYGDYDVDGMSATALLLIFLRKLGAKVRYYIPRRLEEGYGLNKALLRRASAEGFKLIFTVDCGIAALEEVVVGREYGLDFIITDHHEPLGELPPATAVLNPKREDCSYPFPDLAGVGVAFKVVQALGSAQAYSGDKWWREYLDLVALGTIADVVPLRGENRILVKYGLEALQDSERVGIRALLEVAGLAGRELKPGHIGFYLGPRLNACGRLGRADGGVQLLVTNNKGRARELAQGMERENRRRQEIERTILAQARAQVEEEVDLARERVIVLGAPAWHPGVIGIVASRLVELYYRPTLLISLQEGEGRGSARSIPGFHMFKALGRCDDLLLEFGGHAQAAGFSLLEDKLAALRRRLNEVAYEWLREEELHPVQPIDMAVKMKDLDFALVNSLEALAPFGMGNPQPVFACHQAELAACREVGREGAHLKLRVRQEGYELDGIGFRLGDLTPVLKEHGREVDLAFALERNQWRGRTSLQLVIKDLRPCHVP
ncbi:MAG: single-stranded-DNA-specific exonuclease RecJ [Firmicutes bacterium]|nr:single-stranded-DNA-specific exonuclease RecJ [Bacillota bacterium]